MSQLTFSDLEYSMRKRKTKREEFLDIMNEIIPWDEWVEFVRPYYPSGKRGRPTMGIETMLRMYLLQVWFNLSDEGVEDAIYDSYAFRKFMGVDFQDKQVPDATTLLKFRHLLEKNHLGEKFFKAINRVMDAIFLRKNKIMAKQKIDKTNAARLLDRAKIAYDLIPYEVDENNLAATHVAEQLGEDIETVFKTLILEGDRNGFLVCVVPGNHEVDLKAAARVSGNKKVEMLPMKELLPTTGYIRGGCSPIGMKKRFPTYIHSSALEHDAIYISAGVRGLQIRISPTDLVKYVGAEVANISHEME